MRKFKCEQRSITEIVTKSVIEKQLRHRNISFEKNLQRQVKRKRVAKSVAGTQLKHSRLITRNDSNRLRGKF